jgi:hypothetical protein
MITEYLIKRNCKKNNSELLMHDHVLGKLNITKMLIKNCNGDYNKRNLFMHNAYYDGLNIVKYLIGNYPDYYISNRNLIECVAYELVSADEYLLIKFAEKKFAYSE